MDCAGKNILNAAAVVIERVIPVRKMRQLLEKIQNVAACPDACVRIQTVILQEHAA